MKIGLVVPGFSASEADWCIPALLDLVRCLAAQAEVHVFALRYPHRTGNYSIYGARVHALGGATRRAIRSATVWTRVWQAIATEHRRQPFHVLHAFWANEAGLVAVVAGKLLQIPTTVSLAGGELVGLRDIGYGGQLTAVERLKTRIALTWARRVTAGSAYLLELTRKHLPASQHGKLQCLPLGVDATRFPYRPPGSYQTSKVFEDFGSLAGDGRLRLLHVANLIPIKDQFTLLQTLAEARRLGLDVTLDVAGAGPCQPALRALADELELSNVIRWHGAVPHDALPRLYAAADAFILSSRHEAQGMAVLEAAATGRATVGTAVGVVPELAPVAATTGPVGDAAALARAVVALAEPGRVEAMGSAARARVEAEYRLEQAAAHFTAMWVEVVTQDWR